MEAGRKNKKGIGKKRKPCRFLHRDERKTKKKSAAKGLKTEFGTASISLRLKKGEENHS